ncbi:hypothetical protein CGMCC3_g511 [Colletotrichum fructicola]|nr:uncharacterized protein CGMCC3_g511 [Colletotrichum fructicola]KAE9583402.1 hypothetical protein CGMCC3_g511 [Colletotrichum fructicola]
MREPAGGRDGNVWRSAAGAKTPQSRLSFQLNPPAHLQRANSKPGTAAAAKSNCRGHAGAKPLT